MIEKFIEENIERDVKSFEKKDDLYERYLSFCEFHQMAPLTKIKFGNRLRDANVGVRHHRMRNRQMEYGWQGVRLLPCKY